MEICRRMQEELTRLSAEVEDGFRAMSRRFDEIAGPWSHFVGLGLESMVKEALESGKVDSIRLEGEIMRIPRLRDLKRAYGRKNGYELDLVGYDEDGIPWAFEIKYRAVTKAREVEEAVKSVKRWISKEGIGEFKYVLMAFGGIRRNLDFLVKRRIRDLGGDPIVLDEEESREFLRKAGFNV